MSNVVDFPTPLELESNQEFILDFARYGEGLLSQKFLRSKYKFSNKVWEALGNSERLLDLIEEEKVRKMRNGESKKEKAQLHVLKAPDVLAEILNSKESNPRHRIDSAKLLDDFSQTGPQAAPAADRFHIVINLGADVNGKPIIEEYNKSIAINVDDDANIVSARSVSQGPPLTPAEVALLELMKHGD